MNEEFRDALYRAQTAAGMDHLKWNKRFKDACKKEQIDMVPYDKRPTNLESDEWVMAPPALPGADTWPQRTVLIYLPAIRGRSLKRAIHAGAKW